MMKLYMTGEINDKYEEFDVMYQLSMNDTYNKALDILDEKYGDNYRICVDFYNDDIELEIDEEFDNEDLEIYKLITKAFEEVTNEDFVNELYKEIVK